MSAYDDDQLEAIQAVVDRVSAYQDGAPENTVEAELVKGIHETGVTVSSEDVAKIAAAIEAQGGDVSAAEVLA